MAPQLDARAEATSLMAILPRLVTSVMAGQRSPDDALRLIRYHLDRFLPRLNPRHFPRQRMSPVSGKIFSVTPQAAWVIIRDRVPPGRTHEGRATPGHRRQARTKSGHDGGRLWLFAQVSEGLLVA